MIKLNVRGLVHVMESITLSSDTIDARFECYGALSCINTTMETSIVTSHCYAYYACSDNNNISVIVA